MNLYALSSIIISIAVLFGYINHRFIKMQSTIALMIGALVISLILIFLHKMGLTTLDVKANRILSGINFHDLLIQGMLSFLLFAGALTVDFNDLVKRKWEVGVLAFFSTLASAFLVGIFSYYLLQVIHMPLPFIYCLLFGALISPTDPIAVLATVKEMGAPSDLSNTIAGESLFNDGVGIVIFLTLYHIAFPTSGTVTAGSVFALFCQQTFGGILYGLLLGFFAYFLIKPIEDHKMIILITIGITTGGYAFANVLNVSGPIAMVVSGIFIGNHGKKFFMSKDSCNSLQEFWEIIDEILNTILFLLMGLELLVFNIQRGHVYAALLAIPLVLFVRWITVAIPLGIFKIRKKYHPYEVTILTWGGLRGGLAVAMALALPDNPERHLILTMTYAIVIFAVVVQGMTAKSLVGLSNRKREQQR